MPTVLDTLVSRNERYLPHHQARPPLPTLNTVVVCCMDARVDPAFFLGVEPGEALVLRNAGGRVTPAIEQELGLILALVGLSRGQPARPHLVLVHHTNCGVERFASAEMAGALSEAANVPTEVVSRLAIHDHDHSLTEDLDRLRCSDHLPSGISVSGLRYDETSGRVSIVFQNEQS